MSRMYRHELKFFCAEAELRLMEEKIKHVCAKDPHVDAEGKYRIRSMIPGATGKMSQVPIIVPSIAFEFTMALMR